MCYFFPALDIGRPKDAQLECYRALRQIKDMSSNILPRKAEFMAEILHYKGLALMQQKNYDDAVTTFQEEFNVANQQ